MQHFLCIFRSKFTMIRHRSWLILLIHYSLIFIKSTKLQVVFDIFNVVSGKGSTNTLSIMSMQRFHPLYTYIKSALRSVVRNKTSQILDCYRSFVFIYFAFETNTFIVNRYSISTFNTN